MLRSVNNAYNELQKSRRLDILLGLRQGGFGPVFKMFNRYFIKSLFGPFYLFITPLVLYGILGKLLGHQYLLPGVSALGVMLSASAAMPFSILELRRSVVIKQIGSSPVRPSLFSLVIFVYFLCASFLATAWLMLWSLVFFQDTQMFANLGTVTGFFAFFYGTFLNAMLSIALGFSIATMSKNPLIAQTLGLSITFPIAFLSGQIIWVGTLAGSQGFTIASEVFPFRYSSMYLFEGWTGPPSAPVFDDTTSLFKLDTNGTPLVQAAGTANAFDVHDYAVTIREVPNALGYNENYGILTKIGGETAQQYKAAVIGAEFRPFITVYSSLDHILGYAVPYVYLTVLILVPSVKFSWVQR